MNFDDEIEFSEIDTRKLVLASGELAEITMTNWHWVIYDWMLNDLGWSKRLLMEAVEHFDDGIGPSATLSYYLVTFVDQYQADPASFDVDVETDDTPE